MTDIVARLRDMHNHTDTALRIEAADEIERMRAEPEWVRREAAALEAEIERLRAFAQYVVDMDPDNPAPLFEMARRALEPKPQCA